MVKTFYRMMLMAFFAMWFGGFTFYTAIVVPTGSQILGSGRSQGFITQEVTNWLNFVGAFAIAMFLLELWVERKIRTSRRNLFLITLVGFIILTWGGLLYVHPMLDALIIKSENGIFDNVVTDPAKFYPIHRVYLWISTFQWIGCWVWLFATIGDWTRPAPN